MYTKLMNFLHKISPINIFQLVESEAVSLHKALEASRVESEKLFAMVIRYDEMYQEYRTKQNILDAIERCTSDLQWAKGLDGRYLYANNSIIKILLKCANPIGLTDMEIADGVRSKYEVNTGDHSAGAICMGSDKVVLDSEKPHRFFEEFIIDGARLILEVNKAPMYDHKGELIGTAGTGRVVTDTYSLWEELLLKLECGSCGCEEDVELTSKLKEKLGLFK